MSWIFNFSWFTFKQPQDARATVLDSASLNFPGKVRWLSMITRWSMTEPGQQPCSHWCQRHSAWYHNCSPCLDTLLLSLLANSYSSFKIQLNCLSLLDISRILTQFRRHVTIIPHKYLSNALFTLYCSYFSCVYFLIEHEVFEVRSWVIMGAQRKELANGCFIIIASLMDSISTEVVMH